MTEELPDTIDLDVRLEDVWLAHKAYEKMLNERQNRIDIAVRNIDQELMPTIYTAMSVQMEVKAKVLSAGFTVDDIENYIERKHREGTPPDGFTGHPVVNL